MFRKELPSGHGMLFDFKRDQPVSFWMHNTYISLDMIFIRSDGRILHIAENATPLSDAMIPSGGSVRAVLEVIAGTAAQLGIAAGDRVTGSIFGKVTKSGRARRLAGRDRKMYREANPSGYSAAW